MTIDEKCELAMDIVEPVNEVLGRMMALIERLTHRLDVLELEQIRRIAETPSWMKASRSSEQPARSPRRAPSNSKKR